MMIYVGNLDYTATSDEVRALFEAFGTVTMAEVQARRGLASRAGSRWWRCPTRARGVPPSTRCTARTTTIAP